MTANTPTPDSVAPVAWRCFHCDETFTDRESAAEHFGTRELHQPACGIDVAEYRRMEAQGERYAEEDAECHRTMARQQTEHQQALRRAEEAGYARGLTDATPGVPVERVRDLANSWHRQAATAQDPKLRACAEALDALAQEGTSNG